MTDTLKNIYLWQDFYKPVLLCDWKYSLFRPQMMNIPKLEIKRERVEGRREEHREGRREGKRKVRSREQVIDTGDGWLDAREAITTLRTFSGKKSKQN